MTDTCSTPSCLETEGLEVMEGGDERKAFCLAHRAEIQLLWLAALREREIERDKDNERRRVE